MPPLNKQANLDFQFLHTSATNVSLAWHIGPYSLVPTLDAQLVLLRCQRWRIVGLRTYVHCRMLGFSLLTKMQVTIHVLHYN